MRKSLLGVLLLLALVAAACGGRLSEDEIQAQLATDGRGSGSGGGGGIGADGEPLDGTGELGLGDAGDAGSTGGADAAGGGTDGSGGGNGAGAGPGAGAVEPGANAAAPEGGNGGSTDVGVTADEIFIGNVATLGGPVPGLFRGALVGAQARFALANAEGGLFGRQFKVVSADDNFDAGQNRSKHKELKSQVFAFVGSFSLFDGASVSEIESEGVLDVGRALSPSRQAIDSHFSPNPFQVGWPSTGCKFLKNKFGADKVSRMAFFWGNADAARDNANWQKAACEKEGFNFVYEREFQATESNFTGDVIEMRRRNVEGFFVVFDVSGIARFMKSLEQQDFSPPIKYPSPAAYDSDFIKLAGAGAAEGTIIGQGFSMFLGEDQAAVPEVARFREWMQRVDPGQKIDLFAVYGWMSAEMFLNRMEALGPNVTREGMIEQFKAMGEWDNHGMTPAIDVPGKSTAPCEMYMEVKGGKFSRLAPAKGFSCDGTFHKF